MVLKELSNSERGLYCEFLVYQKFLKKNFEFIDHRLKTAAGEIDLLFYDVQNQMAIAIEVKSNSSEDFLVSRVSRRQKLKLRSARLLLEAEYSQVQMLLAVVSHDASIELFENFLS